MKKKEKPLTNRILEEKNVVEQMIRLYCRKHDKQKELCQDCQELLNYAHFRLSHCRYGEKKPTCKKCPIHCYKPEMKKRMQAVMRWAGPHMLLYHPIAVIKHFLREM